MKQLNPIIGVLCYNRPIHTALTLFFIMKNKHAGTPVHIFYGIKKSAKPPSAALDLMLRDLSSSGLITLHYIGEEAAQNTGSNVDNLLQTLQQYKGLHSCFIKLDDDVLMGKGTDMLMSELLHVIASDNVVMLASQLTNQVEYGANPFNWERSVGKYTVSQRKNGLCVLETFVAISFDLIDHLNRIGLSPLCDEPAGGFWRYAGKCWNNDMRLCTVKSPHIVMQHIGLASVLFDDPIARSWAPAVSWGPGRNVIAIDGFDFTAWELSHTAGTSKLYALDVMTNLISELDESYTDAAAQLIARLEAYDYASPDDVALPVAAGACVAKPMVDGKPQIIDKSLVERVVTKRKL